MTPVDAAAPFDARRPRAPNDPPRLQAHRGAARAPGAQLDEVVAETRRSRERWEVLDELVRDATPVMRQLLGSATDRLGALEARGYAAFVGAGLGVVDRVVGAFDPTTSRRSATTWCSCSRPCAT
jgi:hypothetical protein